MTLRIVGDSDSEYLVADVLNDDGEPEVVQLARFESEKARRLYERLWAQEIEWASSYAEEIERAAADGEA